MHLARPALRRTFSAALAALILLVAPLSAPVRAADELNRSMLDYAFARASLEFYKRTGDQVLLDGAVSGIRGVVKSHGGDPNKIPALRQAGDTNADIAALNRELALANKEFGATVGARALAYGAINGIMQSLHDRWTVFLDPKEYKSLNEGLDGGNFTGIGVVIDIDQATKSLLVVQTIENGPAQKAGLQPGDVVISVDGKSTKGLTTTQDSKIIRGKPGTVVRLVVQRPNEPALLTIDVKRDFIHTPSVLAKVLDGNVGYVQVLVFGLTTGQELTEALDRLDKSGVKGYVLDLRNNGGGYLNAAIDVASKFVADGPIVSIDSRAKPLQTFDAADNAVAPRPLAVLVNGFTASASEIASGAIQDSGTGVLIGTRTFGKGVVQTIYPLPDGSAIKITTARYLTPGGRDINSVGIQPDIIVPDVRAADVGKLESDTQLQRAVGYVQQLIAQGVFAPAPTTQPKPATL